MKQHRIVFMPSELEDSMNENETILSAAISAGEGIETICGGKGSCGKCKIRILEGHFEQFGIHSHSDHFISMTKDQGESIGKHHLSNDERLACQTGICNDVVVFVPEESRVGRLLVRKETGEKTIAIDPIIRKYTIELNPPTLEDTVGDWDRLSNKLEKVYGFMDLKIDHYALQTLPNILRNGSWTVTVTLWNEMEIIRVEPGINNSAFGLAVDVGTTSIAGYLCDLVTGEVVSTVSGINPQVKYGEDVISRIAYADKEYNGLEKLNKEIIDGLGHLVRNIASQAGIEPHDIVEAVLVGNTAMHHIFLGLDVRPLGMVPFTPSINCSCNVKARDLGFNILPSANVHVLPIEAGFVGADNVGVLIAEEPYNQDDILLIIDIGTNGELLLGNKKRLLSSSCATGPALEGASIKFGMRAAKDSIDKVRIDPKTFDVQYTVIGKKKWNKEIAPEKIRAKGICGSGILDAIAEMFLSGIVKKNGSFDKTLNTSRIRPGQDNKMEFVIAWANETVIGQDITVTQSDVRAIQLAKAAIYAGSKLMLERLGVEKPDKVVLAGAFGTVIDKKRALAIGMFPDCGIENVLSVGNAAGEGARFALVNKGKRIEADKMAREVEYVELTTDPEFQNAFVAATHFPHMNSN